MFKAFLEDFKHTVGIIITIFKYRTVLLGLIIMIKKPRKKENIIKNVLSVLVQVYKVQDPNDPDSYKYNWKISEELTEEDAQISIMFLEYAKNAILEGFQESFMEDLQE